MNFAKRDKSIVDFVFILALFAAFMITALFVVLFGSKIYQRTVSDMDDNYASRTALSYITEKIRSHDYDGGADILDISEAAVNGQSVLVLYTHAQSGDFATYMYVDHVYLKEYTALKDEPFDYSQGADILAINEFYVEEKGDGLCSFHIVDGNDKVTDFFVSLYSEADGEETLNE